MSAAIELKMFRTCLQRSAVVKLCGTSGHTIAFKKSYTATGLASGHPAPVADMERASLYVHWPYCKRRCTYCNFNKYINNRVDHERMSKCLQKEAVSLIKKGPVQEITSVFFGGGTPSLAQPRTIDAVLETVSKEVRVSPAAEISMEINPTSIELCKMRDFKAAGINRASVGVQTLNDDALRILGRDHSSSDSLRCLEAASKIFHRQTSVDLMFGYPGQTLNMWTEELKQMLSLCDDHISLYQLTLERGTQLFKDVAAGLLEMPSPDEVADMYLAAVEVLALHDYEQYEISNFARGENYCQHNIGYWAGQQYIGIGPGSHGRVWRDVAGTLQRLASVQTLEPDNWMWEVEKYGHATRKSTVQSNKDVLEELMSVGLRTKWGLSEKNWSALLPSVPLDELISLPRTKHWMKNRFIIKNPESIQATPPGQMILDSILPDILLDIDTLLESSHQEEP